MAWKEVNGIEERFKFVLEVERVARASGGGARILGSANTLLMVN